MVDENEVVAAEIPEDTRDETPTPKADENAAEKAEEGAATKAEETPETKADEQNAEHKAEDEAEEKAADKPEADRDEKPREPASPAPVMTKIHPTGGPLAGGTHVVIEGSGFVEGSEVKIDRVPVKARFVGSSELSFVTLPRNLPGRVDVDVANPDGQRTMLLGSYEYCLAPELASIDPLHAPETGGGRATLTGANLRDGSEVRIGAARPRVEYRGPTCLDIEIPAHPAGTYDVEIVAPDGQQARLAAAFTFDGPPRIDRVVPDHGPHDASARVVLEGDGFRLDCAVYADGARVAADLESSTRVAATLPAKGTPGPIAIRVQNADGLGGELRDAFRYDPAAGPRIALAIPARVPLGRENAVAVTGSGFAEGCSVRVAGQPVPVKRVSADRLELTLPAFDRIGYVDVEVRTLDGQSHRLDEAFELRGPPQLASVQPREGSSTGGMYVQLAGLGLERGCEVTLGGFPARCEWESETSVRAAVPARTPGTGSVDVVVRNTDGQTATLASAFLYVDPQAPVVNGIEPTTGPTTGGTGVLVRGEHLGAVTQVLVGGQPALNFKARGGELAFVTPPRPREGAADIELRTRDGVSTVRKNGFQYTPVPPPAIRSVTPNRGAVAGGTEVTILGENFFPGAKVLVDGEPIAAVKVRDKATIVFTTPRGEEGAMVDVAVRSSTGQEAVAKRAFLYDPRYR
jgi:hypothetical protein